MPDGSLIRDLMRVFFYQKKDLTKIKLFNDKIIKLFSPTIKLFQRIDHSGGIHIYVNSKTLAWFFYYIIKSY